MTFLKRFIVTLPYVVPVFVASFTIVAVIFLVADLFFAAYIWIVGLVFASLMAFLTYRFILPHIDISKPSVIWTSVVIGLCGVWFIGNTLYTSQHLYVDRDPGIYANAAIWLIDHSTLHIETNAAVFDDEKVDGKGGGFAVSYHNDGEVSAQGAHAFPALLALAGKIGGIDKMFHVMPLFGAVALLAFYGFLRLFLKKHKWSIAGVALLAVSLPLLYFSRDTYSEPLALIFTFGAMSLIYFAQKTGSKMAWLAAGLVAGASALTRIDALLAIAGMVAAAFVIVNIASVKERRQGIFGLTIFLAALIALYCLAYYDLAYLSSSYLEKHLSLIKPQVVVVGGIIATGLFMTFLNFRIKNIGVVYNKYKKRLAVVAAYITGIVGIVLVTRPLWYVGQGRIDNPVVSAVQAASGLPVDGWRTYAENSVEWMIWYVGGVTVLLALIGLIMAVMKMFTSRNVVYMVLVTVVGGAAVIYLNVPSITADHIWAARRFLPVIIPGMIVLAMFVLASVESIKDKLPKTVRVHVLPVLLGVWAICFIGTIATSWPFMQTRVYNMQLTQVQAICNTLPENSALLYMDGSFAAVQMTRSICPDIPVGFLSVEGQQRLDEKIQKINKSVRSAGKTLYLGDMLPNTPTTLDGRWPLITSTSQEYEKTLLRPPSRAKQYKLDFYLSVVTEEGKIVSLGERKW